MFSFECYDTLVLFSWLVRTQVEKYENLASVTLVYICEHGDLMQFSVMER